MGLLYIYFQVLTFLLIAKGKYDINGFLNSSSFQQSKLESWVLQNMSVVETILIIDMRTPYQANLNIEASQGLDVLSY